MGGKIQDLPSELDMFRNSKTYQGQTVSMVEAIAKFVMFGRLSGEIDSLITGADCL